MLKQSQTQLQMLYDQAAGEADVSNCVAIAREQVRERLVARAGLDIPEDIGELTDALVGPEGPDSDRIARDAAAMYIGIAIGQFYHADVFRGAK